MAIIGKIGTKTYGGERARGGHHLAVIMSGLFAAASTPRPVGLLLARALDGKLTTWLQNTHGVLGVGDGAEADVLVDLKGPIVPGTLEITDGVETFADDGHGALTGDGPVTGAVAGEAVGTGDGAETTFAIDLDTAIVPGTLVVTDGVETFADDGHGALTGNGPTTEAVAGEKIGEGDGIAEEFTFDLGGPITPGTLVITDAVENFTDDGTGFLHGDGADPAGMGRVNYQTGQGFVAFKVVPADLADILADYLAVRTPGTGRVNYQTGVATVTFQAAPAGAASVDANYTAVLSPGSGRIDYLTGKGSVTFQVAPADEADIDAAWEPIPVGVLDEDLDTSLSTSGLYIRHGSVRKDVLKVPAEAGGYAAPAAGILKTLEDAGIYPE